MDKAVAIVTERGAMDRTVTATTPEGMPNVKIVVMTAAARVFVRVARTYFQSVLGLLGAAAVAGAVPVLSDVVTPSDTGEKIVFALVGALFPAFVSLLQNVLELLAKADESIPELRA